MATTSHAPAFVRLGNLLTRTLLQAGLKVNGPKKIPMYLLTVRGRKTGQPRFTPIVVIRQGTERYLVSPFGIVDWVRNLRTAGEATLTRGRRAETIKAVELPTGEATRVLTLVLQDRKVPSFLMKYIEVSAQSSRQEIEDAVTRHPVFLLRSAA